MYKVFIIEDDLNIAKLLKKNLGKWNFSAQYAQDFSDIMSQLNEYNPDLVLLDVALPFYNGYYWCTEIRKVSSIPIIFISSKNDDMDIVMAMNMGADDYIVKPFSIDIIIAKIQALLRRSYKYKSESEKISFSGAVLNIGDASLVYNGEIIELTKNEFKILYTLLERKGSVVSREDIIKKLWEDENFIDDNTLTVNINRLRKKLNDAGLDDIIKTKKGLGYIIND